MLISNLHDLAEAVKWCDVCRLHEDGKCDGCHNTFSPGERTYHSQSYHFHPATIGGVAGTRSVQKELCVDCYRVDHSNVYQGQPIPDLPDRGVDENYHAAQRTEKRRKLIESILEKSLTVPLLPEDVSVLREISKVGLRFC